MDRPRPCALCREHPVDPRFRPFCGRRCQLQDLGHWADGSYRIPLSPDVAGETNEGDDDVHDL